MKNYRILSLAALATIIATPLQAQDEVTSLAELLSLVEQGRARDNQEEMQRIAEFESNNADQAQLLDDSLTQKANEEARSTRLETTFEDNELLITDVTAQLDVRLGSLRELFGVARLLPPL